MQTVVASTETPSFAVPAMKALCRRRPSWERNGLFAVSLIRGYARRGRSRKSALTGHALEEAVMSIVCPSRRAIRLVALALGGAALAFPARVSAQGMMSGVDLATPAFTQAELSRGDIEGLIAKVTPGQKLDLAGKSLNNLDLSKLDLAGANLRGARLNHANLAGADLRGAVLDDVWALGADFSGADLSGARLFGAQMLHARFDRADLSGARLAGDFTGASFAAAKLARADGSADMKNQSMGLMHAVMRSTDLRGADLAQANFSRADLEFAQLNNADLSRADLAHADVAGADLRGARLEGANLDGADVASAHIDAAAAKDFSRALNLDRAIKD
jgi:uncharacterized protein YjbI with pentapeptide repeats